MQTDAERIAYHRFHPAPYLEGGSPHQHRVFPHTMFNVTDTWFAGRISTETMAALSHSFPIFFINLAVGYGLGTGTTSLVGNALGK